MALSRRAKWALGIAGACIVVVGATWAYLAAYVYDVITFKTGSDAETVVRDATELVAQVPAWLQADHDQLTAKVLRKPERAEIAAPVQEQLIVELYSK